MKIGELISFLVIFVTMLSISASPHPIILMLCYLIHEAGHLFFAKITGTRVRKIGASSFKLCIYYDTNKISYKKELLVCSGGIIFNVIFAILPYVFCPGGSDVISFFSICNLSLAIMNLCPIDTLDGGGMIKSILKCVISENRAERLCKSLSLLFTIAMWLIAVYIQLIFNSSISFFAISIILLVKLCFSY